MTTYFYVDHNQNVWKDIGKGFGWHGTIVFQCQANSILEADILFNQALESDAVVLPNVKKKITDVTKLNQIGCFTA